MVNNVDCNLFRSNIRPCYIFSIIETVNDDSDHDSSEMDNMMFDVPISHMNRNRHISGARSSWPSYHTLPNGAPA